MKWFVKLHSGEEKQVKADCASDAIRLAFPDFRWTYLMKINRYSPSRSYRLFDHLIEEKWVASGPNETWAEAYLLSEE